MIEKSGWQRSKTMNKTYADAEIAELLQEVKSLPSDWLNKTTLRQKRGHKERDLEFDGSAGNRFRLILRQNDINIFDFSIILAVCVPGTNKLFRLRRHNGKSHEHTNHIERDKFYDFHIHMATERYQELGTREDAFAKPTERYSDYRGALQCLILDGNLMIPAKPQRELFEEVSR